MAAQFQPDERDDAHRLGAIETDAGALQELVRELRSSRPLQAGEQERLLELSALGDRPSQDRLVSAHLALVVHLAAARGEQELSVADLVQEGSIGLLGAVRSFADSGATDFVRFAEARVTAHMDAAVATEMEAVRDARLLVAAATDYERAQIVMCGELHREPAMTELAEKLEWTVERTVYVADVVAEARQRRDEELLAFIDPEAIDFDDDDGRAQFDG